MLVVIVRKILRAVLLLPGFCTKRASHTIRAGAILAFVLASNKDIKKI